MVRLIFLIHTICFAFSLCASEFGTIGYLSSWKIKCGIAVYTEHVVDALKNKDLAVTAYSYTTPLNELLEKIENDNVKLLNIQYEKNFFPKNSSLIELLSLLKERKIKTIITVHTENTDLFEFYPLVDAFFFHKIPVHFSLDDKKIFLLPMAVPTFNSSSTKQTIREKYNFDPDDIVLTTFGFMSKWKKHDLILTKLIPWLKTNPHHKLQLLTSYNSFCREECLIQDVNVKIIIRNYELEDQVIHITKFLPQVELSERLWISDLGYLWADINTGSTSAASKEFITSRLPLVLPSSSHFHDSKVGSVFTPLGDVTTFINTIVRTLNSPVLINKLRGDLEEYYNTNNYDVVINRHIVIFESILQGSN